MEFQDAVKYFDNQQVIDAYTSAFLFNCQPDLFDATKRDAEAGWRRTLSAAAVILPARGCIKIESDIYIAGRSVRDYFKGQKIREYLLLHPADELLVSGAPENFLSATGTTAFYAGVSWVKERKEENRTSETSVVYDVYCSPTETAGVGDILKTEGGNYLRIGGASKRSGGLGVLVTYELGANALRSVSYTAAGTYDVVSDSPGAVAPVVVDAFVETYSSNYEYLKSASEKFEVADRVITVLQSDIADPKPGDTFEDQNETFRFLERQADGASCWKIHVRPV